jgi:Mycothiol maleylpyruvate isomerase N-terminal domain.
MPDPEKKVLLQLMEDTRLRIESLIPKIDTQLEIYPGWTIREVMEHVAGWDDAAIATLRAHLEVNHFPPRKFATLMITTQCLFPQGPAWRMNRYSGNGDPSEAS